MLAITHLIVSLLLIQLLMLDRNDAFLALMFGVFIDLDHLVGLGTYARANGLAPLLHQETLLDPGGQWKSILHNPLALGIVGPVSFASRMAIPLIFWGVHVVMDYVEQNFLGNFSAAEGILLCLATFGLITLRYSKYIESYALGDFWTYIKTELAGIAGYFRRVPDASL